ncbi:unnamed protein product, partial [Ixodes persulcatus]
TEKEIRQWYKGFVKDCPSGHLTEQGFLRIYKLFFPQGDPSKFTSLIFRVFDENKVRLFSLIDQMLRDLVAFFPGTVSDCLNTADELRTTDPLQHGCTRKNEKEKYLVFFLRTRRLAVTANNRSESPRERVDKIFEQLDKNHDNQLTLDEFKEGSKQDPKIVQALSLYSA